MRDFLIPNFQPIVDRHYDLQAYEVFIRMRGDKSGSARFVPRWERSRLIINADLSMLDQIGALSCQAAYRGKLRFHLNISAVSIDHDARDYAHRLGTLRPMTRGLTVEIPLLAVQHNYQRLLEFTHLCKHHQVALALEDARLDTAFLSRRFLETVRPNFLKIDARYLLQLQGTPAYNEIIAAVDMAHSLGVSCIVKNIDSEEGRRVAQMAGARYFQGRLIAAESASVPPPEPQQHLAFESRQLARVASGGRLARVIGPVRRLFGMRRELATEAS